MPFSAYLICATPRSGSTLLCDLLTTSGVAGCPNSYFRAEDIEEWARSWGVEVASDSPTFDRAYISAMARVGQASTGLFGLRLMQQSLGEATRCLRAALGRDGDFSALFAEAFGPTLYIHLSRMDKAAQAASLVRALQTGLWHVAPDGSERERNAPARAAGFDAEMLTAARDELAADDRAWDGFFAERGITPLRLTYERFATDLHATLADVLVALGLDPAHATAATVMTRRLADAVNADWAKRIASPDPRAFPSSAPVVPR